MRGRGLPDLLDVNVWVSLSVPDHPHHERARQYWNTEAADERVFNRVTSLGVLRLLTDARTFGEIALDPEDAWRVLRSWADMGRVAFVADPPEVDEVMRHWGVQLGIRGRQWTDTYLAAFATASGSRLVSFDSDFRHYPGLSWLHLKA